MDTPKTLGQLIDRLRELPANAELDSFKIVYRDIRGYMNVIELPKIK